ncbi:hypothetical protein KGF56_000047 [Candida oxycetoniae]|uniref:Leukotriene A(4) hydrolase n=1 Tax=Candida oxycetoniae TaxID=497107 RepID=A0AAI9T238_9ASCO|nr:uncharacterized protein KGF56_000047 [Candida oxycetoniae]KAI3407145.2 hypothetical protein KGF56_000047 [Candida oxycetoniae]
MSTAQLINSIREKSNATDPCTRSNYFQFKVDDTELTLSVSFDRKIISGSVKYHLVNTGNADEVILDTRYLLIKDVKVNSLKTEYILSEPIPIYGSALHVPLPTTIDHSSLIVEIDFETTDKCTAIQFFQGDTGPYVFSQCQAIHARSLFPCFDTPAVKSKYTFTGKSPLKVTMSGRPQETSEPNTYVFSQPIPIPSYLVSITSGNLHKAPIGPRSDVYSEEPSLAACKWEFEKDMENFLQIAESLVFDYEWERFDSLVLPSSFPYGGMEIPNMTQLTPTLICGDRTQTKVMAHELAHSWSGNLVTNCSWEHFWLNEGWTVYLERRIIGALAKQEYKAQGKSEKEAAEYGEKVRHFNMLSGWNDLKETCNTFNPKFTKLVCDLTNQDPDDTFSRIPYEKGSFFLFYLERRLGGLEEFDPFIKYYFRKFRYQSLNSSQFVETLYEFYEPLGKKNVLDSIDWEKQFFQPGLPEEPHLDTTLADEVYAYGNKWVEFVNNSNNNETADVPFTEADIATFQGGQDMLLIDYLVEKFRKCKVSPHLIRKLPDIYPRYATSKNGEIKSRWNELLITNGKYTPEDQLVQDFAEWIGHTGRMKYARPGYKLLYNGVSKEFAVDTFKKYRDFYHPICRTMIEKDLNLA